MQNNRQIYKPIMHEVLQGRLCIAQYVKPFSDSKKFRCFQPRIPPYPAFCDDFGPMNISSIVRFIEQLDEEIASFPDRSIVHCAADGKRSLTNAIFLFGSYMMLRMDMGSAAVKEKFAWLNGKLVEEYRDATYTCSDFGLTLDDCWRGLERAKLLGWVALPDEKGRWGKIDLDEYDTYDDPFSWDLHMVVPLKFIAFRGPKDLGEVEFEDADGFRQFSPKHYRELFRGFGVTTIIRLNEDEYDEAQFSSDGFSFHNLIFEDCSSPSTSIIESFFAIVDEAQGVVAVHCKAGLGRTGTLIGLYLMRKYGFSAREAIGWMRIMRPGSVIGQQQHFLCLEEPPSCVDEHTASSTGDILLDYPETKRAEQAADIGHAMQRRSSIHESPQRSDDLPSSHLQRIYNTVTPAGVDRTSQNDDLPPSHTQLCYSTFTPGGADRPSPQDDNFDRSLRPDAGVAMGEGFEDDLLDF